MTNEPEALREIHEIRIQIYEETKGMTFQERSDRSNAAAAKLAQQYGLSFSYTEADKTDDRRLVPA